MSHNGKKVRKVPEPGRRCVFVHPNNERCKCLHMIGFDFCYFHEDSIAEERREAQIRGGHNSGLIPDTPPPSMESLEDVRQFAVETLHQVRTGAMEPRQAAVISSLMAHILKTLPDLDAGQMTAADQLRDLLMSEELDVSESPEDDEAGELVQGNGSGKWQDNALQGV